MKIDMKKSDALAEVKRSWQKIDKLKGKLKKLLACQSWEEFQKVRDEIRPPKTETK